MTTAQQIRIHQLLLEREALFARIHACEQEAARLLGEQYPFARPVLPSDQKTKKKSANPRAAAAARDPLRRLEEGEARYRVLYKNLGREFTEVHEDLEALRALLACQTGQLRVLRIETIDSSGNSQALLFEA